MHLRALSVAQWAPLPLTSDIWGCDLRVHGNVSFSVQKPLKNQMGH